MSRAGRPFRALGGAALVLAVWVGARVPAMQRDMAALTLRAAPPPSLPAVLAAVLAAGPASLPVAVQAAAQAAATPVPLRLPARARQVMAVRNAAMPAPPAMLAAAAGLPAGVYTLAAPAAPPPSLAVPPHGPAFSLAAQAYERLRAGQRRQAAALLDAALAVQPGNRQWQADRAALGRRWQVGGFALLRGGGSAGAAGIPAASPVLGGGQMGIAAALAADPLARRPIAVVARANVAADTGGVRRETAQAAIGIRQTLLPGVTLSAERLIALGSAARGDWTLRLAAGSRRGRFDGYGEAGVLGSGQLYAGAQAAARVVRLGPAALGAGAWASVQTGSPDVWRVDVGPVITASIQGIRIAADWRQRVGGNAAPGSGPVLTVSTGF